MRVETETIQVKVITGASLNEIVSWQNECLKVKVVASPEKGKANKAVINLLSKKLNIPISELQIIKGFTSQTKKIVLPKKQFNLLKSLM